MYICIYKFLKGITTLIVLYILINALIYISCVYVCVCVSLLHHILSPVWSPHTPEWPARRTAGSPRGRARPGSRSSAPRQTGRGRQSRTRYSSRTWPAVRCSGSAVWSIYPAALSASASGGRQRGSRFTTQWLPVRTIPFESVWNLSISFL